MALVLHHSRARGTDKLVLLGIANHASDDGAWPGIPTLAKYANVTDRAVQQSLGRLVKLRELAVMPRAGGTWRTPLHQRPNRYDVLVNCPPGCDRTPNHRVRPEDPPAAALSTGNPDPVKPTSPGEAHFTGPGEAHVTTPVKPTSPEPSGNHQGNQGVTSGDQAPDRARVDEHNQEGVEWVPAEDVADLLTELRDGLRGEASA